MKKIILAAIVGLIVLTCPVVANATPDLGPYDSSPYFYQPTINTIDIVGNNSNFVAGDVIHVKMTGTPHAKASFDIVGVKKGICMKETSPGTYEGSFKVPTKIAVNNARISGRMELGGVTRGEAVARVNIRTSQVAGERATDDKVKK